MVRLAAVIFIALPLIAKMAIAAKMLVTRVKLARLAGFIPAPELVSVVI